MNYEETKGTLTIKNNKTFEVLQFPNITFKEARHIESALLFFDLSDDLMTEFDDMHPFGTV